MSQKNNLDHAMGQMNEEKKSKRDAVDAEIAELKNQTLEKDSEISTKRMEIQKLEEEND